MTRMPQTKPAPQHRPRLNETDAEQVVLGVDSHQDTHVAAVITHLGAAVADRAFPATAAGYRQLLAWARGFGRLQRAGVEGTGCYGVALARYLRTQGITVIEVNRPDRAARRRRGKTDAIDAQAAAYAVLSGRATTVAKTGDGPVEMTRMFKLAKASAVKSRTQAINQLKAVLVCADPPLRESLSGLGRMTLIRRCATLPAVEPVDVATAAVYTLRQLAQRILNLTGEIRDLQQRLTDVITAHAPQLLHPVGVGADSAAALLIAAGDNPDRLASEASFAALCGVSPIEMSSGKTERHRLNRGGDRHANAALYRIVLTRLRGDARTQAYVDRRTAQGKTRREIIRCLKRYVAREIYNLLQSPSASQASPQT